MDCLFSDVATCSGSTSEHIIQECLGGTLERQDLICDTCNHYFGNNIDPGLCAYYSHLVDILRPLMPSRFRQIARHVQSTEGDISLVRNEGGIVGLRKMKKEYNADGSLKTIYAPGTMNRAQLEAIAKAVAPGITPEFSTVPLTELTPVAMSSQHVFFRPSEHRAAAKSILEVLDYQSRSMGSTLYARLKQLKDSRDYIRNGLYGGAIDPLASPMYNLEEEFETIFGSDDNEFSNRVIFCNYPASKSCYGFIQLLNTMPLGIRLGDNVEEVDFTILYESGILGGGTKRSERMNGALISFRAIEYARFLACSRESVMFAFAKMRQSFDYQLGRATILVDNKDDSKVGTTLTTYAIDAILNRRMSGASLLREVCEPVLKLRFHRNAVPDEVWNRILSADIPSNFDSQALVESIEANQTMGPQMAVVLGYFRKKIRCLVDEYGFPKMTVVLAAGIGSSPQPPRS